MPFQMAHLAIIYNGGSGPTHNFHHQLCRVARAKRARNERTQDSLAAMMMTVVSAPVPTVVVVEVVAMLVVAVVVRTVVAEVVLEVNNSGLDRQLSYERCTCPKSYDRMTRGSTCNAP